MPFVLMIRERGYSWAGRGPITMLFPSREEAEAELLDYVRENWDAQARSYAAWIRSILLQCAM